MNLLSNLMDIIYIPLGLIFKLCYLIFSDYGLAILMFAFIARLAMLPFGIKNERNRLKMMSVQPKMAQLQAKYRGNTRDPKYAQEMQELYEKEGYNPMSGCLPQLIQLPLIWAIWNAIRRPLSYICDISVERIREIAMVMYNNGFLAGVNIKEGYTCLLYTSTSYYSSYLRVSKLCLCLPLKLRFSELYAYNRGKSFSYVLTGKIRIRFL